MKTFFKLGFLAFVMSLSLSACDWFSSKTNKVTIDSNKIDSNLIDSNKIDTNQLDSTKINVDSVPQAK
jgi:hypothetical protein